MKDEASASKRIEADLRARIQDGRWKAGLLIPSRRSLAKEYGVDLLTLQRAIGVLIDEGMLRAENRRGTFVANDGVKVDARLTTMSRQSPFTPANVLGRTLGIIAIIDEANCAKFPEFKNQPLQVVSGIERVFSEAGGNTILFNKWTTSGKLISEVDAIKQLMKQGVDAIVSVNIFDDPLVLAELRAFPGIDKMPIIYVSGVESFIPSPHIYYNNRDAGYKAAECLCRAGHREVVFFAPFTEHWIEDRIEGARLACQNASLPVAFHVYPTERDIEFYQGVQLLTDKAIADFVASKSFSGGIITTNDDQALHVMSVAKQQGLEAGVHYGLVGFDDEPRSVLCGLTTIRPPFEDLGQRAASAAIGLLSDSRPNTIESLRSVLIQRQTHLIATSSK